MADRSLINLWLLDAADAPAAITAATPEDENLPAGQTTTPPRPVPV